MSEKNKGRLFLVATALLWALGGVCVKSITWNSMQIMGVRGVISFIVIMTYKKWTKLKFTKNNILAGAMMTGTAILYMTANKLTTAGTVIVLEYTEPIIVFLYQRFFKGRKAKLYEAVLVLFVFIGCVLAFSDNLDMSHMLGNILALLSGFTLAAQVIIMTGEDSDSLDCLSIGCLMQLVIGIPFLFIGQKAAFTTTNIFWILVLALFQYSLANICFSKGCKLVDPLECSLILTIEPIANPIMVALVCGEMMGPMAIIGCVIVIISVTLYTVMPSLIAKRTSAE